MAEQRDKRFSSTLARGLAVLRAFRPSDRGLGNQEISERTGIPKPTVYRLTRTLCADGYLTQGRRNDKYHLGPGALALGQIAAASFGFVKAANPLMQALADRTGTLVGIAIQDGVRMLLCQTWTPDEAGRDWMEAGYHMPIATSSSGRAYLGAISEDAFAELLSGLETKDVLAFQTARTDARQEIYNHGFTCIAGEARYSSRINAVAVPYCPAGMGVPVAFVVGAAARSMSADEMRSKVGPELTATVSELKRAGLDSL